MNMESPNSKNARILIVDDNPKNIQVLGTILKEAGYQITVAQNGIETLDTVEKNHPDLIILDIMMPEMDGFETCKRLKTDPQTQAIPIIFLTSKTDIENLVEGFELGAVDYIAKPFNAKELLTRVSTHLELKFNREALQHSYDTIKNQQDRVAYELDQARKIQLAIQPKKLPAIPHVQISTKFIPMDEVGGDCYQIVDLGGGKYGIMIADVSGHGIPAALVSTMISSIFKDNIRIGNSTKLVLETINQFLEEELPDEKFATMFYAIYDSTQQTLLYTRGGHPPGLVVRQSPPHIHRLDTNGKFLGIFSNDICNFGEKEFQLLPGDKLILYTDALIEARNSEEHILGTKGLLSYLEEHSQLPIEELTERLYGYGLNFSGQSQYNDDYTMIGLEVLSPIEKH